MAKRSSTELAFSAIRIEGGFLAADFLGRIARFDATGQAEADYDIPKGLKLRDEIGRYWKIALNLWQEFNAGRQRIDHDAHRFTSKDFLEPFCRHVLGFTDIQITDQISLSERIFPIGYQALAGQVPLIFAAHSLGLEQSDVCFGDDNRRRSPFLLAQEYLNAADQCLWAIVSNGLKLRILRDNPSLTRPAYIEVDLESIFNEERYPDFTALWLLAHATRFGSHQAAHNGNPADCHLEHWRNTSQESGIRARDRLRDGVGEALRALGTGFISHPKNTSLREQLDSGTLSAQAYYEQLLRLIYRFIFLATLEDRQDEQRGISLVFAPDADEASQERYLRGYSLNRLRDYAAKRRYYDRYSDLWQSLNITFAGLAQGQPALGLPALGGLFVSEQCPQLDGSQLENRYLLQAVFGLCFFRESSTLTRVNYRDMDSEELGSVYESLLELVPVISGGTGSKKFGFIGDEEAASTQGNARKLSGSYYTPDSLVQELIKSALEPVIVQTLQANPQQPVKALLGLTVCDPACGSGHFLLAAARRIAEEVARLNASEGNPQQSDYRHALREVVAHCIYGVDKNPMAIELARTALWLEAYTPDRPLTFLDHHLRCGDALLGVLDPAILKNGIPNEAFNALSGDDKAVVKALKKANSDALKAIEKSKTSARLMHSLGMEVTAETRSLESLPDDTLDAIAAKRAAFVQVEAHAAQSRARIAADLFVAAFVMPKTPINKDNIPTSADLWLAMNDSNLRQDLQNLAMSAAVTVQALHWWQVFPQVRAKGGFDVLLGNPPWDQLVFREQEFFATTAPSIAQARTSSDRERLIVELSQQHPMLYKLYLDERRRSEAQRTLMQDGGQFPLTGRGRSNTFSLFAELCWKLAKSTGRVGLVVPSGIVTDDTTKVFFQEIIKAGSLVSLFDFENRLPIFPDIDSRTKFCLLTMRGANCQIPNLNPLFVFFAQAPSHIKDPERQLTLSSDDFKLLNPNTLTACIFRTRRDADLTIKLHRKAPALIAEEAIYGNAWQLKTRPGLFNMAGHSSIFKSRNELLKQGGQIKSNIFHVGFRKYLPLYEGKMVGLYDHRAADVVISLTATLRQGQSELLSDAEHSDPSRSPMPRHWIDETTVMDQIKDDWDRKWLIGWKEITSPTNERTLIPAVLPLVAIGHKFPIFIIGKENIKLSPCLLGCLSSLVCDFIVRQKLGTTSLTPFTIKQLPILSPDQYTHADFIFITTRVLELTYTAHDLKLWAEDLGYNGDPFAWDPDRRALLRAELDAYYAKLYSLTRDELRYILDPADVMGDDYPSETFRVLKNSEMRQFGEYRTRRLVLEAWDRLTGNGVFP